MARPRVHVLAARPDVQRVSAAARRLGLDRQTVRAAIAKGDLPAQRLGGLWLVPTAVLDRLAEGRPPRVEEAPSQDGDPVPVAKGEAAQDGGTA